MHVDHVVSIVHIIVNSIVIFIFLLLSYRFLNSGEALALPRVQCPNHPDAILVEDYRAGDMICPECGLVVGECFVNETFAFAELV